MLIHKLQEIKAKLKKNDNFSDMPKIQDFENKTVIIKSAEPQIGEKGNYYKINIIGDNKKEYTILSGSKAIMDILEIAVYPFSAKIMSRKTKKGQYNYHYFA